MNQIEQQNILMMSFYKMDLRKFCLAMRGVKGGQSRKPRT